MQDAKNNCSAHNIQESVVHVLQLRRIMSQSNTEIKRMGKRLRTVSQCYQNAFRNSPFSVKAVLFVNNQKNKKDISFLMHCQRFSLPCY